MKQRPTLILRKGIALAALVAPVVGCGDTPEEAFRASLADACEKIAACGIPDPDSECSAVSRETFITEIKEDAAAEGVGRECLNAYFEVYADYYGCFANLSCEAIASEDPDGSCTLIFDEAQPRILAACPELGM